MKKQKLYKNHLHSIKKLFFLLFIGVVFFSCSADDDICTSGEATPRIKIKFKNKATGNQKTLSAIFVKVDYGAGPISVISRDIITDSVFIPLRVDHNPFTEIYVSTSSSGPESKIKINYTTKTEYVSPACGIKKLYENVNFSLENPNPVLGVEANQNQILDEDKTHLFLLF